MWVFIVRGMTELVCISVHAVCLLLSDKKTRWWYMCFLICLCLRRSCSQTSWSFILLFGDFSKIHRHIHKHLVGGMVLLPCFFLVQCKLVEQMYRVTCLWFPLRQGMGSDGFMFNDMLYWHIAKSPWLISGNTANLRWHLPFSLCPSPPFVSSFSVCLCNSMSLYLFLCLCPHSSWLRRSLPCTPWQCSSCLNRTTMILAYVLSPPCFAMLERSGVFAPTFLMKK